MNAVMKFSALGDIAATLPFATVLPAVLSTEEWLASTPRVTAGLDTFAVVLFVAIGRREHEQDSAISGLINTAAPFLIALAIAWLVLRAWKRPTDLRVGVGIWAIVVAGDRFMINGRTASLTTSNS